MVEFDTHDVVEIEYDDEDEDESGEEWSMDRDVEENAEMYEALAGDDGE